VFPFFQLLVGHYRMTSSAMIDVKANAGNILNPSKQGFV